MLCIIIIRVTHFYLEIQLKDLYYKIMLFNNTECSLTNLYSNAAIKKIRIFKKYQNLILVFFKKLVNKLSVYNKYNHKIDMKNKQFLFKSIYNLSVIKLKIL